MKSSYFRPIRAERLVAGSRVLLAGVSLLAIYLDPSEPARYARTTYFLLCLYSLYSLVLLTHVWRSVSLPFGWKLVTHALDLMVFSIFIFLTEGPGSPFMVYFVFALFCAALRFGWRGTLWTSLVAVTAFVGMGIYADVQDDPWFELNRFVIRCFYLLLVAVFLAYLSEHADRLQQERTLLASAPPAADADLERFVQALLRYAAPMTGSSRAILTWEDEAEPFVYVADWSAEAFALSRREPGDFCPTVIPELATSRFLSRRFANEYLLLVADEDQETVTGWNRSPFHPVLGELLESDDVMSVPVSGNQLSGRLFFTGICDMSTDTLNLGAIVAQLISPRLDEHYMMERLRQAAAQEERIRMARDLHDGILQALTGAGLELQALRVRLGKEGTGGPLADLEEIQDVIASGQEELHALIQELRLDGSDNTRTSWAERLEATAERIRRQWRVTVAVCIEENAKDLPSDLGNHVFRVVTEALTNGARHAEAAGLQARIWMDAEVACIEVCDDGHGFSFSGRHTLSALIANKRGPVSLRERVAALGGDMVIQSTPEGSRIDIRIPVRMTEGGS